MIPVTEGQVWGSSYHGLTIGPVVAIVRRPTPLLRAPLSGTAWIAFNALTSYDHRRALQAVDGRMRIAQHFAIDWMRLGPDGRLFHGDAKFNDNFYGNGAEVLAVADARVSDLRDGNWREQLRPAKVPRKAGCDRSQDRLYREIF